MKIDENDFDPQMVLGLYKGNPAIRSMSSVKSFKLSPAITAAYMIAILEAVERYVEDKDQIDFEKDVCDYFALLFEERHERATHHMSNPYKLEE